MMQLNIFVNMTKCHMSETKKPTRNIESSHSLIKTHMLITNVLSSAFDDLDTHWHNNTQVKTTRNLLSEASYGVGRHDIVSHERRTLSNATFQVKLTGVVYWIIGKTYGWDYLFGCEVDERGPPKREKMCRTERSKLTWFIVSKVQVTCMKLANVIHRNEKKKVTRTQHSKRTPKTGRLRWCDSKKRRVLSLWTALICHLLISVSECDE